VIIDERSRTPANETETETAVSLATHSALAGSPPIRTESERRLDLHDESTQ